MQYTSSITQGISLTNVMAPVMWYNTCTSLICSHGIGKFSSNFNIACSMYFNALGCSIIYYHVINSLQHSPKIYALVMTVFSTGHVAMVTDCLTKMFWRHIHFPIFLFSLYLYLLSFLSSSVLAAVRCTKLQESHSHEHKQPYLSLVVAFLLSGINASFFCNSWTANCLSPMLLRF